MTVNPDISWSQTRTGRRWDYDAPNSTNVSFWDISHALSHLCRFNGHTKKFYSVAEHSCHVHDAVRTAFPDAPPALLIMAILHDAHEAYLGDVTTPLANSIYRDLPEFRDLWHHLKCSHDNAILSAVGIRFADRVNADYWLAIKDADVSVLMAERAALLMPSPDPWGALEDVLPADVEIQAWHPGKARWEFANRLAVSRSAMARERMHG